MSKLRYDWDDVSEDQPMPGICRRIIRGEKAMIARVTLAAGTIVPAHSHENEQFAILLSGRMLFTLGEEEEEVELPQVFSECLRMFRDRAAAKQVKLTVDLPADAPRLRRIFLEAKDRVPHIRLTDYDSFRFHEFLLCE